MGMVEKVQQHFSCLSLGWQNSRTNQQSSTITKKQSSLLSTDFCTVMLCISVCCPVSLYNQQRKRYFCKFFFVSASRPHIGWINLSGAVLWDDVGQFSCNAGLSPLIVSKVCVTMVQTSTLQLPSTQPIFASQTGTFLYEGCLSFLMF